MCMHSSCACASGYCSLLMPVISLERSNAPVQWLHMHIKLLQPTNEQVACREAREA